MITEAQLAANRANAQKSTGPKSSQGKINASCNSFKHGLYSKQLVISPEDAAALDELKADLRAEHQPVNQTEEILVNELAEQFWRLRRARAFESSLLDAETIVFSHLAAVQRMMSSAERGFHKALTALRQLQKDRGFVPQKQNRDCHGAANSGFVPPPCPQDDEIDPADWARAFETRNKIHTTCGVASPGDKPSL